MTDEIHGRPHIVGKTARKAGGRIRPGLHRVFKEYRSSHLPKTTIILILVCIAYISLLLGWAEPIHGARVLVSADLHTEHVSYRVVDAIKGAFFVEGMKGGPLGANPGSECLAGLFTPARNATVTYGRRGEGSVEITVEPDPAGISPLRAGHFQSRSTRKTSAIETAWFMTSDPSCKSSEAAQFPIWGDVSVGREFRPPSNSDMPEPSLLIDGTIQVAARSAFHDALYTVTSLSIPTGARLEAFARPKETQDVPSAIWWGTAYVDPQRTALVVNLATEAPDIALYRPNRTVADRIGASGLAQLTDDPDIIRFHILALVFVTLIVSCDWMGRRAHHWLRIWYHKR